MATTTMKIALLPVVQMERAVRMLFMQLLLKMSIMVLLLLPLVKGTGATMIMAALLISLIMMIDGGGKRQ
jgi:hypothetical protein